MADLKYTTGDALDAIAAAINAQGDAEGATLVSAETTELREMYVTAENGQRFLLGAILNA